MPLLWSRKAFTKMSYNFVSVIIALFYFAGIISSSEDRHHFDEPIFNSHHNSISDSIKNYCKTPACITRTIDLRHNLDRNVDPCDNFYNFACGGWIENNKDVNMGSASVMGQFGREIDPKLKAMMEEPISDSDSKPLKMLKTTYRICMDNSNIEKIGADPLKKILKKLGGWPVIEEENWNESEFDWLDTLIMLRNLGFDHNIFYLSLRVLFEDENPIIDLENILLFEEFRNASMDIGPDYEKIVKIGHKLGVDQLSFEIMDMMHALQFQTKLIEMSIPLKDRIGENYFRKLTVKEIQFLAPEIPWLKFFNGLLGHKIEENEQIRVYGIDFVIKFAKLITEFNKKYIANYMMWKVIEQSLNFLSKEFRQLSQAKEETCLDYVKKYSTLQDALEYSFVQRYIDQDTRRLATEITHYIHKDLLETLENSDWIDDESKMRAIAKIKNLDISYIGYHKELLNDTYLSVRYGGMELSSETFLEINLELHKLYVDYRYSKLKNPNIGARFEKNLGVTSIGAVFHSLENSLSIPATLLMYPYMDKNRPQYLNFGSFGSIVGHEMSHALDNSGVTFDENGEMRNLWSTQTQKIFKHKTDCIAKQFSDYKVQLENFLVLNGYHTINDDMADIQGMKEAYNAYQAWVRDHGTEKLLPSLKYTPNQHFWISAANVLCSYSTAKLMDFVLKDVHSPSKIRIIGALSNSEEFSEDFNCPPDSTMNAKKKCELY